ncbi:MAG TPA: sulfite exporter TauE/SafE family protein [Steroidobacteraceae bacterium]|nr:sulfite exporter TauE/SafE family protein [Steroidobacteraceae bacterium]
MATDVLAMSGAAILAGLAGSMHCVGMCGGIAGALAMRSGGADGRPHAAPVIAHHAGRLISYAIAGGIAGGMGASLAVLFKPEQVGPWLRIAAGVLIVLLGLRLALRWNPLAAVERAGARIWSRLAPAAGRLAGRSGLAPALGLGALWGFLPCGLVYSVLLIAVVSGSAWHGSIVMLAFGLGTLPSMLTSSLVGSRASRFLAGARSRVAASVVLVAFGIATAALPLMHMLGSQAHEHDHGAMHRAMPEET